MFTANTFVCRLIYGALFYALFVTIFIMMMLSLARYLKIANSKRYKLFFTVYRTKIIIILCHVIAIMITIPPTVGFWAKFQLNRGCGMCMYVLNQENSAIISYLFGPVLVIFILASVVTFACYYRIYIIARASTHSIIRYVGNSTTDPHAIKTLESKLVRRNNRLSKTIFIIYILYVISYMPYTTYSILTLTNVLRWNIIVTLYVSIFAYFNTIVNPILLLSCQQGKSLLSASDLKEAKC